MIVTVIVLSLADYHRVVLNQAVTFNSSWALNSPADPVDNEVAPEHTGEAPQPQAQQAVGPRSWPSQLWIEFFTHVRISSSVYTMLSYITSFSGVPSSESRRLALEAARGRDKPATNPLTAGQPMLEVMPPISDAACFVIDSAGIYNV